MCRAATPVSAMMAAGLAFAGAALRGSRCGHGVRGITEAVLAAARAAAGYTPAPA